jgi:hypothetical protein
MRLAHMAARWHRAWQDGDQFADHACMKGQGACY